MTTQEYISKLNNKISKLQTGLPVGIAAQDTHVKMVERIFEGGKDAEGKQHKYKPADPDKPLYVNPNNSPKKFPTKGKPNDKGVSKSKFANGEPHKTGYFESYKAYREKIGRDTEFVNLNLWGNLQNDFGKGVIKGGPFFYTSGVSQTNVGKYKNFSSYFKLNKEERANFKEVLNFEVMQILK